MNIRNIGCLVLAFSFMVNGVFLAGDNESIATERSTAEYSAKIVSITTFVGGAFCGLSEFIVATLTGNKMQYIKKSVIEEAKFGAKAGGALSVTSVAIGYCVLKAEDFYREINRAKTRN